MTGTFKFKIPEAYAQLIDGGIKVTLVYPPESKREYTTKREYSGIETVEFGIETLEKLLSRGYAQIGNVRFPSRPASGGIIDVLSDTDFFSHRRDGGTKIHPWYHGIPSGFPMKLEHFLDIYKLQRKEGAEESILFTMDEDQPWAYVPSDEIGKTVTIEKLKQLDLVPNRVIEATVEYITGPDVLEIRNEDGNILSRFRGYIYLSWEHETNVLITNIRYWPKIDSGNVCAIDPQIVFPIDAEVAVIDGQPRHLNRESFRFSRSEIESIKFGDTLQNPRVYRLSNLKPIKQTEPPVPYIFKPDDGLRRMLDGMRLHGWKDRWVDYEIEHEKIRLKELRRG